MIVSIEIEQFCKELEEKLPKLDDVKFKYWKDKVHLLNRVSLEFMEYEDLMRKVSKQNSEVKVAYLKQKKEILILQEKVKQLEYDLETLKENIK